MTKDILTRPFPPELIRQRPGQNGKTLSYVETHAVIARLNEGCEAWSFEVTEHLVYDNEVVVIGKLTADGITKMAFGGSAITKDSAGRIVSLADDLKSAGSDCLKKAASLLGVGLELYGAGRVAPTAAATTGPRPQAPEPADRLTGRQLAAIQGAVRRQSLTREQLDALLVEVAGKHAPQFLTRREASAVLDRLGQSNGHGNGVHA